MVGQAKDCVVLKFSHPLLIMLCALTESFIHSQEEYFFPNSCIGGIWASRSSVSSFVLSWESALEEDQYELQNMTGPPHNCKPRSWYYFPGLQMRDL